MPQIICKGLKEQEVIHLSKTLSENLAEIMNTPKDWFLFEYIERKCYVLGEKLSGDPIIDIWWFDRGQDIKDKTAQAIDKSIRVLGYEQIEIVFHECKEDSYFENGKHY